LAVVRALRAVRVAWLRVERAEVFAEPVLRFAELRLRVAAAFLAAALRWVFVWVAICIGPPDFAVVSCTNRRSR
jgi:hypothetical protein